MCAAVNKRVKIDTNERVNVLAKQSIRDRNQLYSDITFKLNVNQRMQKLKTLQIVNSSTSTPTEKRMNSANIPVDTMIIDDILDYGDNIMVYKYHTQQDRPPSLAVMVNRHCYMMIRSSDNHIVSDVLKDQINRDPTKSTVILVHAVNTQNERAVLFDREQGMIVVPKVKGTKYHQSSEYFKKSLQYISLSQDDVRDFRVIPMGSVDVCIIKDNENLTHVMVVVKPVRAILEVFFDASMKTVGDHVMQRTSAPAKRPRDNVVRRTFQPVTRSSSQMGQLQPPSHTTPMGKRWFPSIDAVFGSITQID